jgi:hypothetical protein
MGITYVKKKRSGVNACLLYRDFYLILPQITDSGKSFAIHGFRDKNIFDGAILS